MVDAAEGVGLNDEGVVPSGGTGRVATTISEALVHEHTGNVRELCTWPDDTSGIESHPRVAMGAADENRNSDGTPQGDSAAYVLVASGLTTALTIDFGVEFGDPSDGEAVAGALSVLDNVAAAAFAASKDTGFRDVDEDRLRGAIGVDRPSGT